MKKYFERAGLDSEKGKFSLRSLRATVTTRLNQHGVDDRVIMARTGHRSQAGLDRCNRPGLNKNIVNVSEILTLNNPRKLLYRAGFIIAAVIIALISTFSFIMLKPGL